MDMARGYPTVLRSNPLVARLGTVLIRITESWPMSGWFVAHLAATAAMVGFIWTIQLLSYPMMASVPAQGFVRYEEAHQRRVTSVLAVLAPAELVTAVGVVLVPDEVPSWLTVGAGAILAGIWVSTGVYFAPLHGRLAAGFEPDLHRRLVRGNWWRTAAWTVRGAAAVAMVVIAA